MKVAVLQPMMSGMWSQQKSDDLMAQMAARLAFVGFWDPGSPKSSGPDPKPRNLQLQEVKGSAQQALNAHAQQCGCKTQWALSVQSPTCRCSATKGPQLLLLLLPVFFCLFCFFSPSFSCDPGGDGSGSDISCNVFTFTCRNSQASWLPIT